MNRFESFEQFLAVLQDAQERGLKNINCFMLPQAARELIRSSRLYYMGEKDALAILEDHDRFMLASFFSRGASIPRLSVGKPVIATIPFDIKRASPFAKFEEGLRASGFELAQVAERMSLEKEVPLTALGGQAELMTQKDAAEVFDL